MSREVDFAAKPIDPDFMNKPDEYPETGTHFDHKVFAEGIARPDADGNPYPTKLGIHGLHVAVDFDGCATESQFTRDRLAVGSSAQKGRAMPGAGAPRRR